MRLGRSDEHQIVRQAYGCKPGRNFATEQGPLRNRPKDPRHYIELMTVFLHKHPFRRNAIMFVSKKILGLNHSYLFFCTELGRFLDHNKNEDAFDAENNSFLIINLILALENHKTAICKLRDQDRFALELP